MSREAFEKWFGAPRKLEHLADGESYKLMSAHCGWIAWKAAEAAAVRRCAEIAHNYTTGMCRSTAVADAIKQEFPQHFEE